MHIRLDIEVSPRAKRVLSAAILALASAVVTSAHADWTADVEWIKSTQPLSATKLRALFDEAGNRLTALESDVAGISAKPVVTKNGKQWSLGATYCGITGVTDGAAGGYATTKTLCEQPSTGCSSASAHVCTGEELVRSASSNIPLPPGGWYNRGERSIEGGAGAMDDCGGWTSNGGSTFGPFWSTTPSGAACNTTHPILCCE